MSESEPDDLSPLVPRRTTAPTHEPYAPLLALRAQGWTIEAVAEAVNASARAVCRWAAGDTLPLPVYAAAIDRILAEDEAAGHPRALTGTFPASTLSPEETP